LKALNTKAEVRLDVRRDVRRCHCFGPPQEPHAEKREKEDEVLTAVLITAVIFLPSFLIVGYASAPRTLMRNKRDSGNSQRVISSRTERAREKVRESKKGVPTSDKQKEKHSFRRGKESESELHKKSKAAPQQMNC
jgi:hypothetical protein